MQTGFANTSGWMYANAFKQEYKAAGCKKPLFMWGGRKTQEYQDCVAGYLAQKEATAASSAAAAENAASAAKDIAAAEQAKTARSLQPGQKALLIGLGVISVTIVVIAIFKR